MKKIITVLACLLCIGASGFAHGANETESPAQEKSISIIVGSWWEYNLEVYEEKTGKDLFDAFEKETGYSVNVELLPFSEIFSVTEVRMKSKNSDPDVLYVDAPLTASYAARGYLEPLTVSDNRLDDFFPATVEIATWDSTLYSMPFENSTQVMFVNKTLFQQAGLEPPVMDVNKRITWEQAIEMGLQIQNKLSTDDTLTIWGLVFEQANNPYQMLILAQSKGAGSGVSPDGLHVDGYLNNGKWVETLQWWYDLFNKSAISPKGVSFNQAASMFSDGHIAMFVGGTWDILTFEKAAADNGLDYDIVPIPSFFDGIPVTPTNSFHLGINAYGNHKDVAMELIEYLTRDDIQENWFRATAQLVANKSMLNVANNDSYYSEFPWNVYSKIVVSELEKTAQPRPSTPFYGEWENLVNKAFTDVSNGADPKETLDSYTAIIERTSQKYR